MGKVRDFHRRFGHHEPPYPPLQPDPELVRLRLRLVREEYEELRAELTALAHAKDPRRVNELLQKVLKETIDLCYVAEGTAVALGMPFEEAYDEVHRSNMSKTPNGPYAKPTKGPTYFDADMSKFVSIIEEDHHES